MTEERVYNKHQFKQEDITRLKQLITEGGQVLGEIDDLKAGLSETIKSIAEEMDIKSSQLSKAVRIAHKASLGEEKEKLEEIEDILEAAGRISA
jgi:hypothetical protein